MKFVQLIEFSSSRIDELRELGREAPGTSTGDATGMVCADRDNPGRYVIIVQFPSYEEAMENSQRPETSEFAARMSELMDGPPTYRNLDVREELPG